MESSGEYADRQNREPIDENVKEFRRVDDGVVYVLGVNGTLWREGPAPLPTAD
jgi:hypothetical protein